MPQNQRVIGNVEYGIPTVTENGDRIDPGFGHLASLLSLRNGKVIAGPTPCEWSVQGSITIVTKMHVLVEYDVFRS